MLIAFEGIDGSGKTTLSVEFTQWLNERKEGNEVVTFDGVKTDSDKFIWTKEPDFTTDRADELNAMSGEESQYAREALFFKSRLSHQRTLQHGNWVCDRYIWSALAYSQSLSPMAFPMLKELYSDDQLFVKPYIYVLMSTPIDVCAERRPDIETDLLYEHWKSYEMTRKIIERHGFHAIVTVDGSPRSGDEKESIKLVLQDLTERFEKHQHLLEF